MVLFYKMVCLLSKLICFDGIPLYQMDTTLLWDELFCTQLHYFILKEKYNSLEVFSTKGEKKKENYLTLVRANLLELVTPRKIYSSSNLVRI